MLLIVLLLQLAKMMISALMKGHSKQVYPEHQLANCYAVYSNTEYQGSIFMASIIHDSGLAIFAAIDQRFHISVELWILFITENLKNLQ